jgi:hypothetical protein
VPRPEEGVILPFEQRVRLVGANATHLVELDWDSDRVWQYEDPYIHHDFHRLPSGNTVMPVTVEMPEAAGRAVRGGIRARGRQPSMLADDFIEVDREGKELRRVHLWQLFDPRRDPICPLERREEWTHVNAVDVNADGDLLFSCRENSRVGIINTKGELTWRFGAPVTSHQHHATFLRNGNIQIFDNGTHAIGFTRSRVIEVDPKTDAIVWEYIAEPQQQFFSSHISSAERLSGDNVLVCEGASGRVFEVTQRGEIVWEWISPFEGERPGRRSRQLFRAHRYPVDHPALKDRELDPAAHGALNRLYGLE